MENFEWIGLGVNAGLVGLFGWVVRHVFQHTIPRLAGTFENSLDKITEAFDKSMAEERRLFREEMKEQRDAIIGVINAQHRFADRLEELLRRLETNGRNSGSR